MDMKAALARVAQQLDLNKEEMQSVMRQIMTGECSEAQIAAFLMGMRIKSETIEEIAAAASVMRELADKVELPNLEQVVDLVGTGGDGANLFNLSSSASFVVAAAGGKVAKHGNRAVSSNSGSADLLEAAGIYLALSPKQVALCIESVGVGFMFAQVHHQAMRHAAGARRALGLRSLFNLLGPLTNPAGVRHQVVGVFNQALCRPLAEVLRQLGSRHVLVVHSHDGLDEFSLAAASHVAELKEGQIREYDLSPDEVGLPAQTLLGLSVDSPAASLALVRDALGKRKSEAARKAADLIALNAGAALYAADLASSFKEGVQRAQDAVCSGLAREKMDELAAFTQVFREENQNNREQNRA